MLNFMQLPEDEDTESTFDSDLRQSKVYQNWAKKDAKKAMKAKKQNRVKTVLKEFKQLEKNESSPN